ncbi:MAG: archease [Calditrichaeota bacterium]|nr:MAG: archease [Calditrichota bacterium]
MDERRHRYKQIEHTADAGIQVFGATLGELFENAAFGLFDIIGDLERVEAGLERAVSVTATDLEALLVAWLSELNFLFQTEREIYNEFRVTRIDQAELSAVVGGEKLDLSRHEIYTEVKAVTYHQLYVKQTAAGWEAQVIFDL